LAARNTASDLASDLPPARLHLIPQSWFVAFSLNSHLSAGVLAKEELLIINLFSSFFWDRWPRFG
jgi:hypothetical protein